MMPKGFSGGFVNSTETSPKRPKTSWKEIMEETVEVEPTVGERFIIDRKIFEQMCAGMFISTHFCEDPKPIKTYKTKGLCYEL